MRIRTEVGRILGARGLRHDGRDLDRRHLGKTNFVILKGALDRQANAAAGRGTGQRSEFSRQQLEAIEADFDAIVARAVAEVIGA
jgi:hypothetical protein